jgi:uncharacterized protein YdhG (YjbR/CyaY superfamily)
MNDQSMTPATIDDYIKAFPPAVRAILERIRQTVREAAPEAAELISYRMPAFKLNGILVYFAAFKNHIGLFPPVRGDVKLVTAAAPYAGEKGNLRFSLDEPIPYDLIKQIVSYRRKEHLAKVAAKSKKPRRAATAKHPVRRAKK